MSQGPLDQQLQHLVLPVARSELITLRFQDYDNSVCLLVMTIANRATVSSHRVVDLEQQGKQLWGGGRSTGREWTQRSKT